MFASSVVSEQMLAMRSTDSAGQDGCGLENAKVSQEIHLIDKAGNVLGGGGGERDGAFGLLGSTELDALADPFYRSIDSQLLDGVPDDEIVLRSDMCHCC